MHLKDTITELRYRRFSRAERDRRWAMVRALMERENVAAIVAPHNTGNSTDWQADARYLSHCGGGADASIACVFPLNGEVTVVATSAERWGPAVQDWVDDVREAGRRYGAVMAERLLELGITTERVGICGMGGGTRAPEGTIAEGTFRAIADALPNATFVNATDLLQEARGQKSDEEVAVLQRSVDLVECGIDAMAATAQPGVPDYYVWAETMHALFARGSELSVHYNWIAAPQPGRTMTRPTGSPLARGDVIVTEIEASVIGYRAQQVRPVAVHEADPAYVELSKFHGELYPQLLAALSPGMTVRELLTRMFAIGAKQRASHGVTADAKTSMIVHGRGLGDDYPLLVTNLDGRPSARTERMLDYTFPANGVYILKPTISSADNRYQFIWGDTVHVGPAGARRMGRSPHGLVTSQPRSVEWPQDVTVYS